MKKSYNFSSLTGGIFLLVLLFSSMYIQAQVGIGTTTPNASSALDISSTTQGLLTPRMTTAQRLLITTPANSLLVYDTDLKSFYYYDTTVLPAPGKWIKINSSSNQRDNYKLVKSAADLAPELAAGGSSKYLLQTNTYYEINGTITLAHPIDLNDAYISGLDANEDKLLRSTGNVFAGATGGSIRNLTITGGGTAFAITGGTSLLVQNTIIGGMSSVGKISGVGLYFGNIVQFISNAAGITYENIGNLLLNNQAWLDTNNGTFEKFTGTFGLIEKVSGFSTVNGADVAIDVSSNPTVGNGVILGTVFSGTTSEPNGYIRKYTTGSYPRYNFTSAWSVNCPGLPRESDDTATGDINFAGGGATTSFSGNGVKTKISGTTSSNNLFRFEKDLNNKIIYRGNTSRYFQVVSSLSFEQANLATFIFYIAVNGNLIQESKVYTRPDISSGIFVSNDAGIQTAPIVGNILLNKNDFVEIYAVRDSGAGNISTVSLNLSIR